MNDANKEYCKHTGEIATGKVGTFADGTPISAIETVTTQELAAEIGRRTYACMIFWFEKESITITEDIVAESSLPEEAQQLIGTDFEYPRMDSIMLGCNPSFIPGMMTDINREVAKYWEHHLNHIDKDGEGFYASEFEDGMYFNTVIREGEGGDFSGPSR